MHAICIRGRCRCIAGYTGTGYECIKKGNTFEVCQCIDLVLNEETVLLLMLIASIMKSNFLLHLYDEKGVNNAFMRKWNIYSFSVAILFQLKHHSHLRLVISVNGAILSSS